MPALNRRHNSPNLRQAKMSGNVAVHPMVKSGSSSSEEVDLKMPKQVALAVDQTAQLPARYESDEESVSPCPEDFDDGSSFSDIEFDSSIDLDTDEIPSIAEVKRMSLTKATAKPILINLSKAAPIEKRATPAHVRPVVMTTSIGRKMVVHPGAASVLQSPVVALQRPPLRFRAPPPVPPRNDARVGSPVALTPTSAQQTPTQAVFQPRQGYHAPRPSVSTISTRASMDDADDCRSSTAGDSVTSSAPSSVADEADLAARYGEDEMRKDSSAIRDRQEADLERAINDYMMWRSEGSPGEPPESVYKLSHEDKQMVRDHEEDEWRRELEKGLATPTPTSYAAYDPFGMCPPSLARPKAPFQGASAAQPDTGRARGFRKGFGMGRRAT